MPSFWHGRTLACLCNKITFRQKQYNILIYIEKFSDRLDSVSRKADLVRFGTFARGEPCRVHTLTTTTTTTTMLEEVTTDALAMITPTTIMRMV